MKTRLKPLLPALCICLALCAVFIASSSWAANNTCATSTSNNSCDDCISAAQFQTANSGTQIINAIFTALNGILANVESSFYNNIINSSFKNAVGAAFLLYVLLFGMMITFNLTSYRMGDIVKRMFKVAIVYGMTTGAAWTFFNSTVSAPILYSINELISIFSAAGAGGAGINITLSSGPMDSGAFSSLAAPMTQAFSVQYITAILSMFATGTFGWLVALFMIWGLVEFLLMIIGAIFTYGKAIIGLSFLLGIAPIFFIFLMFERSQNIFFGWVNQVLGFALQPVLLFAFLAFYVTLISNALGSMFSDGAGGTVDFCWSKWFSMPGNLFDVKMWRPVSGGVVGGDYTTTNGATLPEPFGVTNVLFFLLVSHLGRTFQKYIADLSRDITEGIGPGIITGADAGGWMKRGLFGGRGMTSMAKALSGGAMSMGGAAWSKLSGVGAGKATVMRADLGAPQQMKGGAGQRSFDRMSAAEAAKTQSALTRRGGVSGDIREETQSAAPKAPGNANYGGNRGELKMLVDAYRNLNNKYGGGADKERNEVVRSIEALTGKPFDPSDYSNEG